MAKKEESFYEEMMRITKPKMSFGYKLFIAVKALLSLSIFAFWIWIVYLVIRALLKYLGS